MLPISKMRNVVRALIVRNGAVLVQHKSYEDGSGLYTMPGGAPELGETLIEGLQRECLEEIGSEVEVLELIHVADLFKPRDTDPPSLRQQVEFLFRCRVPGDYVPHNGHHPDKHQDDVLWLMISELPRNEFFPQGFSGLTAGNPTDNPVYLGMIE